MYIPEHFAEHRPDQLQRIIRDHPLGILVHAMDADHLPFDLDTERGPLGLLTAHVARANPLWQSADGLPVMVIFRGADAYVSPNSYVSKHETHRQVPTWNYEVVHVHGILRVMPTEKLLRRTLALLTRHHESSESRPWRMGDAPREYLDEMVAKVVGIEVEPQRIECKRKLNQNKDARDRHSAIKHLHERGHETLASVMQDTTGL